MDSIQDKVVAELKNKNNIFIHGYGGTGKSYLIREVVLKLVNYYNSIQIVSPTGISTVSLINLFNDVYNAKLHSDMLEYETLAAPASTLVKPPAELVKQNAAPATQVKPPAALVKPNASNIYTNLTGAAGNIYTNLTSTCGAVKHHITKETHDMLLKNVKISTLHSFLGIGLGIGAKKTLLEKARKTKLKALRDVELLIIDEISMIGKNLFETTDYILKSIKENNKPFGGVRVYITGDLLQLSPINDEFVFKSKIYNDLDFKIFILDTPYRTSDNNFLQLLKRLRKCKHTKEDILFLNSLLEKYYACAAPTALVKPSASNIYTNLTSATGDAVPTVNASNTNLTSVTCGTTPAALVKPGAACSTTEDTISDTVKIQSTSIKPIVLCNINSVANNINSEELNKLTTESKIFNAIDGKKLAVNETYVDLKSSENIKNLFDECIPNKIELKVGAIVMLRVNLCVKNKLINGLRGKIISINSNGSTGAITVLFNGFCENTLIDKYIWKRSDGKYLYTRTQIPLIPAYAITIHKSQGLTLDSGIVDLGSTMFSNSAMYVALSRFRTTDNLYILDFDENSIRISKDALDYVNLIENTTSGAIICN